MLRLSEIYTSIQGEGPNVGYPTQFIRFAGCNLRCPGWPCDTQHAIDPKLYRNEWRSASPSDILKEVTDVTSTVTLTGGEPILQFEDDLSILVQGLMLRGFEVELFTNGTLGLPDWVSLPMVTTILDWKLPGSGENISQAHSIARRAALSALDGDDAIKFVCKDVFDFTCACDIYYTVIDKLPWNFGMPHIYVGAVWGVCKESDVAEWMLTKPDIPFMLNVQMHNYIWPPHERAR
jgi:7-carboxy-7-deazaguanine synthase